MGSWALRNRRPFPLRPFRCQYKHSWSLLRPARKSVSFPIKAGDFQGTPVPAIPYNPPLDTQTYYGKYFVPTQRPWVEWWRPFYSGGMYAPAIPVFSDVNPLTPHFLVYGDYRAGVGVHRDNGRPVRSIANRLNLDLDLRLTGTERIHAFMGLSIITIDLRVLILAIHAMWNLKKN